MPNVKQIVQTVVISAITTVALQHYASRKG